MEEETVYLALYMKGTDRALSIHPKHLADFDKLFGIQGNIELGGPRPMPVGIYLFDSPYPDENRMRINVSLVEAYFLSTPEARTEGRKFSKALDDEIREWEL